MNDEHYKIKMPENFKLHVVESLGRIEGNVKVTNEKSNFNRKMIYSIYTILGTGLLMFIGKLIG